MMTIKHPAMKAHGVEKTLKLFDKRLVIAFCAKEELQT
jgi:hypothetical protein